MLDLLNFPSSTRADVQIFNTGSVGSWHTWAKPRGKSMLQAICLSGGGGGGSGSSTTAGSAGNGGGSSSTSTLIVPLVMVPDTLFIQLGTGGTGGTGVLNSVGAAGIVGTNTYISIDPSNVVNNYLLTATPGVAGLGGVAAVATAGTAAIATAISSCPLAGLGKFFSVVGQGGGAGSDVGNTGTAIAYPVTGGICTAGSGGGSPPTGTTTGVVITPVGVYPGQPAASAKGADGYTTNVPLMFTGGAGGAGGGTGGVASFAGGYGGYGCGGGGGGGSDTTSTSGAGGRGGDGLVIIICW